MVSLAQLSINAQLTQKTNSLRLLLNFFTTLNEVYIVGFTFKQTHLKQPAASGITKQVDCASTLLVSPREQQQGLQGNLQITDPFSDFFMLRNPDVCFQENRGQQNLILSCPFSVSRSFLMNQSQIFFGLQSGSIKGSYLARIFPLLILGDFLQEAYIYKQQSHPHLLSTSHIPRYAISEQEWNVDIISDAILVNYNCSD